MTDSRTRARGQSKIQQSHVSPSRESSPYQLLDGYGEDEMTYAGVQEARLM